MTIVDEHVQIWFEGHFLFDFAAAAGYFLVIVKISVLLNSSGLQTER